MSDVVASTKQMSRTEKFKHATAYAKSVYKHPEKMPYFNFNNRKGKKPYQAAIQYYMTNTKAGDIISEQKANDNITTAFPYHLPEGVVGLFFY